MYAPVQDMAKFIKKYATHETEKGVGVDILDMNGMLCPVSGEGGSPRGTEKGDTRYVYGPGYQMYHSNHASTFTYSNNPLGVHDGTSQHPGKYSPIGLPVYTPPKGMAPPKYYK